MCSIAMNTVSSLSYQPKYSTNKPRYYQSQRVSVEKRDKYDPYLLQRELGDSFQLSVVINLLCSHLSLVDSLDGLHLSLAPAGQASVQPNIPRGPISKLLFGLPYIAFLLAPNKSACGDARLDGETIGLVIEELDA